jgi:hypothetical protein
MKKVWDSDESKKITFHHESMDGDGNNFPLLTNKFSRAVSRDVSSL